MKFLKKQIVHYILLGGIIVRDRIASGVSNADIVEIIYDYLDMDYNEQTADRAIRRIKEDLREHKRTNCQNNN